MTAGARTSLVGASGGRAVAATWAWSGRSLVNKSTCLSISHRRESQAYRFYQRTFAAASTLALDVASLTH